MNLRSFLVRLRAQVAQVGAPFPIYDGIEATLKSYGVGYFLTHQRRVGPAQPWFDGVLAAQHRAHTALQFGGPVPDFNAHTIQLLVHWPYFLWNARQGSGSPLTGLARELLYALRPLIRQFAPSLVVDLERWRMEYVSQTNDGLLYFVPTTEDDEHRLRWHLIRLIKNTPQFTAHLHLTMRESLEMLRVGGGQRALGQCPERARIHKPHKRGETCESCANIRWVRRGTTLLWLHLMDDHVAAGKCTLKIHGPDLFGETKNPWHRELEYLTDVSHVLRNIDRGYDDGVVRYDDVLLVNWARVIDRARHNERETPALKVRPSGDVLDDWHRGIAVRDLVQSLHPKVLATTTQSLASLVQPLGWRWDEEHPFDQPYGLYSIRAIYAHLEQVHALTRSRAYSLSVPHKPVQKKVRQARLDFFHMPVYVMRRQAVVKRTQLIDHEDREKRTAERREQRLLNPPSRVYYFTLPLDISELDYKLMQGVTYRVGDRVFWSTAGLHRLAKLKDGAGEVLYPHAEEYLKWAIQQEQALTPERFRQLVYATAHADRVKQVARGERQRVGRFVPMEDERLRLFINARNSARPVTKQEWADLLETLPGRTLAVVQYRIRTLGKEYAKQHGWVAYTQSPWCLRRSAKLRKQWLSEGIPLDVRRSA